MKPEVLTPQEVERIMWRYPNLEDVKRLALSHELLREKIIRPPPKPINKLGGNK